MTTNELQNVVFIEGIVLCLIVLIILSAFRRWKILLGVSSVLATAAIFYVWQPIMAFGSLLVYGPASLLLWLELEKQTDLAHDRQRKLIRFICWSLLGTGVTLLILKNIYNIYTYLQ